MLPAQYPQVFVAPQATDLEQAVLGALLLEKDAILLVEHLLKPEVFYSDKHQLIYAAIQAVDRAQTPIDLLTVSTQLLSTGDSEKIGGIYYLSTITKGVVSSANIEQHVKIILQAWTLRKVIHIAQQVLWEAYQPGADGLHVLEVAESSITSINGVLDQGRTMQYAHQVWKRTEAILANDGTKPAGLLSGFPSLDIKIIAFFAQLYIIAARPAMGKTAFLVQLVKNLSQGHAAHKPVPVGMLELETAEEPFIDRHLSNISGIAAARLKMGGLEESEKFTLSDAANDVLNTDIYATFLPSLDMARIRHFARLWRRKYGIRILFIDYLQLIAATEAEERMPRERQVAKIATGLAGLAIELNIPIVALAQLSRGVTNRSEKRPSLQDIRESGAIEQAGRCIMFLHRPEYYGETEDAEGNQLAAGTTELIIAKNNEGETGTVNFIMKAQYSKFIEADTAYDAPRWSALDIPGF